MWRLQGWQKEPTGQVKSAQLVVTAYLLPQHAPAPAPPDPLIRAQQCHRTDLQPLPPPALTSFPEPPGRTQSSLSLAAGSVRSALNSTFISPSTGNEYDVLSTIVVVAVMLVAGTCNTILNKLQDQTCVRNCDDPDPANHRGFEQPLWQTLNMFLGEWLCLVIMYAVRTFAGFRGWRKSLYRTFYGSMPTELDPDDDMPAPYTVPATPSSLLNPNGAGQGNGDAEGRPPLLKITRPGSSTVRSVQLPSPAPSNGYRRLPREEVVVDDVAEAAGDGPSEEEPVRVGNVGKVPNVVVREFGDELEELHGWKVFLLMIPTVCDIIGTTLMNVGLLYTTASIYQMLRGSVVLCTGILSFLFLRRRLFLFQWLALLVIVVGIGIVGASPLLESHTPAGGSTPGLLQALFQADDPSRVLAGTFMILLAQLFTSSQFIIEERLLARYSVHPMEAIGYEGSFGLLFLFLLAPPAYFIWGRHDPESWFNVPVAWEQVISSPLIWGAGIGCVFSIAAFNGTGLEVTKRLTATSRSTVDACRTILIWGVSMALGWESFRVLQVCGFVVLLYGTFTFNGIVPPPACLAPRIEDAEGVKRPLLAPPREEDEER
ncbi:hypothetical protein DFJ74DRAFT_669062 [Hyaloraphidium curvatum]|nr:hypothetical protein DFJ74DRAFT_669062 [Hyaloraphidium curvatum]